MEYIIYSDESDREGKFFGNFYGASLVRSTDVNQIEKTLRDLKSSLNLDGEMKWTKVPSNEVYFEKYKKVIDCFFHFVKQDLVKIRIMFTQNKNVPQNLTKEQSENEFLLLYYQFLKHAFGLKLCDEKKPGDKIRLKFYFDDLPIADIDSRRFKDYIYNLAKMESAYGDGFEIRYEDMAEVNSKNHCIMQCLDIILGSITFRLNNKHKEKPPGQRLRSKGTVAKEKMYKIIYDHIREIHPNFNAGVSTGDRGIQNHHWKHPYSHWLFVPKDYRVNITATKKHKK